MFPHYHRDNSSNKTINSSTLEVALASNSNSDTKIQYKLNSIDEYSSN